DANSLVIKPRDLVKILQHLKTRFPRVERITSYARSDTVARIDDPDLTAMAKAGLNRIHIGLESGADQVLEQVQKGVTKAVHIKAGLKVKNAGMELSEYVMPGLGGKALSQTHALETADTLNQINPDFIRLRTLALPNKLPLAHDYRNGTFEKCSELEVVKEIFLFIQNLQGITSMIKSDHILNLFQEIEGKLPHEKENLIYILKTFLEMKPERQCLYMIGRRTGILEGLMDLEVPNKVAQVEQVCGQLKVTPGNVDQVIEELMKRFV
ncbi:MAG: radical SAM protein, partial [bacterium]|nr:radical SAM protein [bacterium]